MKDLESLAKRYKTKYTPYKIDAQAIWDTYKTFALREGILEYFVMKMNAQNVQEWDVYSAKRTECIFEESFYLSKEDRMHTTCIKYKIKRINEHLYRIDNVIIGLSIKVLVLENNQKESIDSVVDLKGDHLSFDFSYDAYAGTYQVTTGAGY